MSGEGPPDEPDPANSALAERYARLAPKVILVLVWRLRIDSALAQDLVQDVFQSLLATRLDVAERGSEAHFVNYLTKAAINRYRDRWRRRRWEEQNERVLLRALATGADPEREAAVSEELALLREALRELPPPYDAIFRLLLERQLPLAEVARELGIKPGSVYTQFQRGLDRLRRAIEAKRGPGQGG